MRTQRDFGLALLGLALLAAPLWAQEKPAPALQPQGVYLGMAVEPTAQNAVHPGVMVREVTPDGPAAKADLQRGDIIVKAGDTAVKNIEDLMNVLHQHKPGDKVRFEVWRGESEKDMTVALGEQPRAARSRREGAVPFLGVRTENITPDLKEKFNLSVKEGIVVTDVVPNAPAAKAGLQRGDVMVRVDDKDVRDTAELRQAIHKAGVGREVDLGVLRGQEKKEFHVRLQALPLENLPVLPMVPSGDLGSRAIAPAILNTVTELERRVKDLEKQVHDLQQKANPPAK